MLKTTLNVNTLFLLNQLLVYNFQHYLEPREKIPEVMKAKNLDVKSFFTVAHGDVVTIDNGS